MASYITNGARLGWLLLPRPRTVEVWRADASTSEARFTELSKASQLEAGAEFPGLVMNLEEIWAV
jgi:Uma2 family endonuclease